ncbi:MAG: hypothetical protein GWN67_21295 [Phycisphaerae bacterium]|nr:hypothetical protein [Phycisphaerae bacterium]NIR67773.1 hypothetical protein [candidate division Zixibacteria bacterium]NIP51767.1 hypothetical protein [Phycisphaerae bacterium]NIS53464.1 hypothetical protein [Phycisphaerae bacterium]NIU10946.1 hypothetical protein [Phycisphaerae bacterium]
MRIRIVGLVLFLLTLVVYISAGGPPGRFIYLPGLAIIVFGTAALTLMIYKKGDGNQKILKDIRKNIILSSLLAAFISFMDALLHIDISPFMFYQSLIVPLYGLILYCIIDTFID